MLTEEYMASLDTDQPVHLLSYLADEEYERIQKFIKDNPSYRIQGETRVLAHYYPTGNIADNTLMPSPSTTAVVLKEGYSVSF